MSPRDVDQILIELAKVGEQLARLEERVGGAASHEERIRKLEQRWAMLGGIVVFLALELQAIGVILAAAR